jgi:hypothetical protein
MVPLSIQQVPEIDEQITVLLAALTLKRWNFKRTPS